MLPSEEVRPSLSYSHTRHSIYTDISYLPLHFSSPHLQNHSILNNALVVTPQFSSPSTLIRLYHLSHLLHRIVADCDRRTAMLDGRAGCDNHTVAYHTKSFGITAANLICKPHFRHHCRKPHLPVPIWASLSVSFVFVKLQLPAAYVGGTVLISFLLTLCQLILACSHF